MLLIGLVLGVGVLAAGVLYALSLRWPAVTVAPRIGGEVIKEADDFFGKTVIVAARIADHAGGGEIVVSASVKALINGDGEFAFDEGRRTTLKGLAGEQQVFRVVW